MNTAPSENFMQFVRELVSERDYKRFCAQSSVASAKFQDWVNDINLDKLSLNEAYAMFEVLCRWFKIPLGITLEVVFSFGQFAGKAVKKSNRDEQGEKMNTIASTNFIVFVRKLIGEAEYAKFCTASGVSYAKFQGWLQGVNLDQLSADEVCAMFDTICVWFHVPAYATNLSLVFSLGDSAAAEIQKNFISESGWEHP